MHFYLSIGRIGSKMPKNTMNDTIIADTLLSKMDSLNIELQKLDSIFNNLKNKLK
jgi:hypothetical protein